MDYRSNNIIPFDYVFPVVTLLANGSSQQTLQTEQSSQFELHEIFGTSSYDAVTDYSPNNFSVLFTDQSTHKQMSNLRVPQRLLCAPSNRGYRQIRPILFSPGAIISADVLELSGHDSTVTIVWSGYLIMGVLQ